MPSYFHEVFHLKEAISILTKLVSPICALFFTKIVEKIYSKFGNDFLCIAYLEGITAFIAGVLYFVTGKSLILDIVLMILMSCSISGISCIVTSFLPSAFKPYELVATAAGFIDGTVYLGSTISTYLLASVADNYGWNANIAIWFIVPLFSAFSAITAVKSWNNFCTTWQKMLTKKEAC